VVHVAAHARPPFRHSVAACCLVPAVPASSKLCKVCRVCLLLGCWMQVSDLSGAILSGHSCMQCARAGAANDAYAACLEAQRCLYHRRGHLSICFWPVQLDDILEEAHAELSEKLSAAATAALRDQDEEGISDALTALQGHTNRLLQRFRRAMVAPKLRLWYTAGVSEAFELAASCQQALGQDAAGSMLACLRAVEEVSTGSDLHVITASKYLHMLQQEQEQQQQGAGAASAVWQQQQQQRLVAATAGCRAAHQARYGDVSDALYEKLAVANRTLYD
jgi:hypothetical protein